MSQLIEDTELRVYVKCAHALLGQ